MSTHQATYYTTSDSRFFLGTVALINSLRLTGHRGEVVVLDLGLSDRQRLRLAPVATVEEPAVTPRAFPKALPAPGRTRGLIVLIDSDMLVVASLQPLLEAAERGRICVFPDPDDRWFEDWQPTFALKAPLRRERYVNAGFIALSVEQWPWLLERWAEVNELIPLEPFARTESDPFNELDPFRDTDQDALNAVLMSEVPAGAIHVEPEWAEAHPGALLDVRIESERTLACADRGRQVTILHQAGSPKAWQPRGWKRDFRQSYVRLLPRLLWGDDVQLRLQHREAPLWLRPGAPGTLGFRAIRSLHATPGAKRAAKAIRAAGRSLRSKWSSPAHE